MARSAGRRRNGLGGGHTACLSIDTATQTGVIIQSARSAGITLAGVMLTRADRNPG